MNLNPFVKAIQHGEIVAFPTETVYGLGADAFNPKAIEAVFSAKGRPADNPLIVHISSISMVQKVVEEYGNEVEKILEKFWPGPLTVILPKSHSIPSLITAGLDTVAVRMPDHPLALKFIQKCGPLVAPSANKSGRPSPTRASHVRDDFGKNLLILDGGSTQIGLESTVLSCVDKPWQILRPGILSAEAIQQIVDIPVLPFSYKGGKNTIMHNVKSPGQKYRHYAPDANVLWLKPTTLSKGFEPNTLYILHSIHIKANKKNVFHFNGNLGKMAAELYRLFRFADQSGYKKIEIEPFYGLKNKKKWVDPLLNRINKAISR